MNKVILEEKLLPSALTMSPNSEDRAMLHDPQLGHQDVDEGPPDQDPVQSPDLNPI